MAENDSQERTEQATPKRRQDALKKGQVARSRELTTALMLIVSALGLQFYGASIIDAFRNLAHHSFSLERQDVFDIRVMLDALGLSLKEGFFSTLPIMILLLVISLLAPVSLGGWTFNWGSAGFKHSRLSPIKGFKRMFGLNALMELVKAIGKFSIVAAFAVAFLYLNFSHFMTLGNSQLHFALMDGLSLLGWGFLLVSCSLLIIAGIDVPYQLWNHMRQLKMTKQEIKDEYKNTEGQPEVKSRLRRLAREFAEKRMMEAVPQADVVITNPEHYSVALKYDAKSKSAPVVVAKGVDFLAFQIRKVAKNNDVVMVQAPPLARSIYYTTEIDHEIPGGLYLAVAQVLAYVYQIKAYQSGRGAKPGPVSDFPIPEELQH